MIKNLLLVLVFANMLVSCSKDKDFDYSERTVDVILKTSIDDAIEINGGSLHTGVNQIKLGEIEFVASSLENFPSVMHCEGELYIGRPIERGDLLDFNYKYRGYIKTNIIENCTITIPMIKVNDWHIFRIRKPLNLDFKCYVAEGINDKSVLVGNVQKFEPTRKQESYANVVAFSVVDPKVKYLYLQVIPGWKDYKEADLKFYRMDLKSTNGGFVHDYPEINLERNLSIYCPSLEQICKFSVK